LRLAWDADSRLCEVVHAATRLSALTALMLWSGEAGAQCEGSLSPERSVFAAHRSPGPTVECMHFTPALLRHLFAWAAARGVEAQSVEVRGTLSEDMRLAPAFAAMRSLRALTGARGG